MILAYRVERFHVCGFLLLLLLDAHVLVRLEPRSSYMM